jgi:hypothetical protein
MLYICRSIFLVVILSFLIVSCNKEDKEIVPRYKTSEVNFNLSIKNIKDNKENPKKVSRIDVQNSDYNVIRGNVPIGIKGVQVISTHTEQTDQYGYPLTAYKSIYFSDKDSDPSLSIPASMNIVLGRNRFTAYSLSDSDITAKNDKYEYIQKCSRNASDSQKLDFYTKELNKLQPVYAQYEGETTVDIKGKNPSVNINMTTKQARLNIVFENDTKFKATYFVFYALDYANTNLIVSKANSGTSSAIVLNKTNISSYAINIYVRYYRNSGWIKNEGYLKYNGSYDIRVKAGVNKTIIYNLNRAKIN